MDFCLGGFNGVGVRVDQDAGGTQSGEMLIDFHDAAVTLASASSGVGTRATRSNGGKFENFPDSSPPGGT